MASYLSQPNPQQFQFTPSTPPVQEAMQALQAKTQYWLSNASQIKSQYDAVLGADYTTQKSKDFVEGFRKEIEPKLKDIAKQDLSIGEIKNSALKLFEPAARNQGLLIDEHTTKLAKDVYAQAKADSGKNGGNYNAYSVEYTSQMMERFKRENNNENSDYLSIIQANGYQPYNEKVGNEIRTIAEKFGKEKVKSTIPLNDGSGRMKVIEEPAYTVADLSTIIRENLSPAAQKLYDLQAKVQFNKYQLNTSSPEELQKIGTTIKQQYNSFYDEKISNIKFGIEKAKADFAKTATNDIQYEKIKSYTEELIAQGEQQIKVNEQQRDQVTEDYFTNPTKWKLGETYYSDLFINQKIRDDATALVNRKTGVEYKVDQAYFEQQNLDLARQKVNAQIAAAKAKADKESGVFEPITSNEPISISEGSSVENRGNSIMETARHLKVNEDNKLTTQVLNELGIAGRGEDGNLVDFNKFAEQFNETSTMKEALLKMDNTAVKTITDIFNSTKTNVPKDKNGNILWDKVKVIDVKHELNAAMQDPEQIKAFIRRAGFENGKIDVISNLYYQNGIKESNKNNLDIQIKPTYEKVLQKYGIKADDIYNYDTSENIAKNVNFSQIENKIQRPLKSNEKQLISDYLAGKVDKRDFFNELQGWNPSYKIALQQGAKVAGLPFSDFIGKFLDRQGSALHHLFSSNDASSIYRAAEGVNSIFTTIEGQKSKFDNAKKEIQTELGSKDRITFSAVSSSYLYSDKLGSEDPSKVMDYSGLQNLLNSTQGSEGGDNSSGNVSRYKTILSGLQNAGLTDAVVGVKVIAGGENEISPYMLINFNSKKIKAAIEEKTINEEDDGNWFNKSDLEKILAGEAVKLFLTDNETVRKYVKIPDRTSALLSNGKGLTFETFSGNKITANNTAINGGLNNITPGITGKAKMITNFDGKTIEIEDVDFSPRNMDRISQYQGITNETINPNNKTNGYKGLQSAIQYILNEDAKMKLVTEFAEKKGIVQIVNGKSVINLQALNESDRTKLLKIIQDGKI